MVSEGATKNIITEDKVAEMDVLAREAWVAAAKDERGKAALALLQSYMEKLGR